jgi:hypothetical protein
MIQPSPVLLRKSPLHAGFFAGAGLEIRQKTAMIQVLAL